MKRSLLITALLVLIIVGFLAGLARLFALRYASGDVYPVYSTLRADPLGAKAILDALAALPGVETQRNFLPLKKLSPATPITLAYLGTPRFAYWTEREFEELERMISNGSRVVIAFAPFERPPDEADARRANDHERKEKREREKSDAGEKKKDDDEETNRSGLLPFSEVAKKFGFDFAFLPGSKEHAFDRRAYLFAPGAPLERDLTWHSALYFKDLSPDWKPLYLAENQPVVVERTYGRGSLILVGDSYLLSNEAMRRERRPQFLARLFDGPSPVIFDEEHLGVRDDPGIAQLVLKYRLQGVAAALVLLAALFVWKNASRLIPAFEEPADRGDVASARDTAQGFENLLHRAIPRGELLGACADQWRRSFARQPEALAEVLDVCRREQARPARQRDVVAAYREIARRLQGKLRLSPP